MLKLRRCRSCQQRCHHRRDVRLDRRTYRMARSKWTCLACGAETESAQPTPRDELVEDLTEADALAW